MHFVAECEWVSLFTIYILCYFDIVSRSGDMKLTPQWRHGAVPEEDVLWVHKHMADKNVSFLEALQALHNSLFPDGYQPHPFKQSKNLGVFDT